MKNYLNIDTITSALVLRRVGGILFSNSLRS